MNLIPFSRLKIVGHSMEPSIKEGEIVWVFNWAYLFLPPKIGQISTFKLEDKILVKRISGISEKGYFLTGDNKNDSFDSRKFGLIPRNKIIGQVLK